MKKAITTCLRVALLVMTVLYPAGTVISAAFGYSFELFSVKAFAVATAVLSVCTVILDYSFELDYFYEDANSKFLGVLLALNTPLSLVNAAFYCFECGKLSVVLCIWLSAVCCSIMSVRRGLPYTLKVMAITLVTVMVIPLVFISFVLYVFEDFGKTTVTTTVESPDRERYAQVLDSDHGALGGATAVTVHETGKFDVLLFSITKKPQRVYLGRYGEADGMSIWWKDDGCLVINGEEYEIE